VYPSPIKVFAGEALANGLVFPRTRGAEPDVFGRQDGFEGFQLGVQVVENLTDLGASAGWVTSRLAGAPLQRVNQ